MIEGNGAAKSSRDQFEDLEEGLKDAKLEAKEAIREVDYRTRNLEISVAEIRSSLAQLKGLGSAILVVVLIIAVETAIKFGGL